MEAFVNELMEILVGIDPSLASYCALLAPIICVVLTVLKNRASSTTTQVSTDAEAIINNIQSVLKQTQDQIAELKNAQAETSEMFIVSLLGNKTITPETKQIISEHAAKINAIAKIDFSSLTKNMLEAVTGTIPSLDAKKEEIVQKVTEVETALDAANEKAQSVVSQLLLDETTTEE